MDAAAAQDAAAPASGGGLAPAAQRWRAAVTGFTGQSDYRFGDITRAVVAKVGIDLPDSDRAAEAAQREEELLARLRTGCCADADAAAAVAGAVSSCVESFRRSLPSEWTPNPCEHGDAGMFVLDFEEAAVVQAAKGCYPQIVQRSRDSLAPCLGADFDAFLSDNRSRAAQVIEKWRSDTTAAFAEAEKLHAGLEERVKEAEKAQKRAEEKRMKKKAHVDTKPVPDDDGSDASSEEDTAVFKAARRGARKGLKKGLKVFGVLGYVWLQRVLGKADDAIEAQGLAHAAEARPAAAGAVAEGAEAAAAGVVRPGAAAEVGESAAEAAAVAGGGKRPAASKEGASKASDAAAVVTAEKRLGQQAKTVATAGAATAVLCGADALRQHCVRREEEKVLKGKEQAPPLVEGAVVPALQDAAVAGAASCGTAAVCVAAAEHTAFQAGGRLALVGRNLGPVVSGVFCAAAVGGAVHAWSAGKSTGLELRKSLVRVGWGVGAGLGCVAVAGAATLGTAAVPLAAAIGVGTLALDLSGLTDGALDAVLGKGARQIRVQLITKYAEILQADPKDTDDGIRESYNRTRVLLDPFNEWGGTNQDIERLDVACAQLFILRNPGALKEPVSPPA